MLKCERLTRWTHPYVRTGKYAKYYIKNIQYLASQKEFRDAHGSGAGSRLASTRGVRATLPRLVEMINATTLVDVPCGDFNWMRTLVNATPGMRNLTYWGGDIVRPLVEALNSVFGEPASGRVAFGAFDLATQTLWPVDIVMVRDVLFHFPPERGLDVLRRIDASGSRFLLTTYFPGFENARSVAAYNPGRGFGSFWRVNLLDAPFNLPPPLLNVGYDGQDGARENRVMGLWRLPLWSDRA
mmetsp:Transcript_10760/g.43538  ORF Transcript_10760/g.43538 Transcript_10760/m.43538 type:complete len:241 (-) Transcript_10760:67-789(-)